MKIYYEFPYFTIIGAQKAGTSALFEYLKQHPNLQATGQKELHYFDLNINYKRGLEYYQSFFNLKIKSKFTFDASAGYLCHDKSAERIHQHNPYIKIIVLLRDPVYRAFSAWNMYKNVYLYDQNWFFNKWVDQDMDNGCTMQVFRRDDNRIFDFSCYVNDEITLFKSGNKATLEAPIIIHGHYYEQLQRYFNLFERKQILIIESNEMLNNTVSCLKTIEDFLKLPSFNWRKANLQPVFNGRYSDFLSLETKALLTEYYAPLNEKLFCLLGNRFSWCE